MRAARALALTGALVMTACSPISHSADPAPGSPPNSTEVSGELTVYAAASLQSVFTDLAAGFSKTQGDITFAPVVFDGSSTLATQLSAGAAADLFVSADEASMRSVEREGLILDESVPFASNELVIVVAQGNPFDISSLADLEGSVRGEQPIVVLCAPKVPCGSVAQNLLSRAGVALSPASEELNVNAVLAKVIAGEADAGLVYRTDAIRADGAVEMITIDGADDHRNRYVIGVLRNTDHLEAATAFREYVKSETGRAILDTHGFGAP